MSAHRHGDSQHSAPKQLTAQQSARFEFAGHHNNDAEHHNHFSEYDYSAEYHDYHSKYHQYSAEYHAFGKLYAATILETDRRTNEKSGCSRSRFFVILCFRYWKATGTTVPAVVSPTKPSICSVAGPEVTVTRIVAGEPIMLVTQS
jgi:hypothetical protein